MKVKIIRGWFESDPSSKSLEELINEWLESSPNIKIIDMKFTDVVSSQSSKCAVLIMYQETK